jgi:hypothetical protein
MAGIRERRRRVVIDSPLQSRFVLAMSWPIVGCIAVTAALLVWFSDRVAGQALEAGVALPGLTPLLVTVLAFMGCAIAYLVWHAFRLSHQVYGPMLRIQRTLQEFREGDRDQRLRFRDGDFLRETAGHLNDFLDWVATATPAEAAREPDGPARDTSPTSGLAAVER